jgi:hypothetical protein
MILHWNLDAVWDIQCQIQTINAMPTPRSPEQDLELIDLLANKQSLEDSWLMVSIAEKKVLNLKLDEDYKTKMKEISALNSSIVRISPNAIGK